MVTELTTRYLPLAEMVPAVRNPKQHADAEIMASIRRFGFVEPVLLDERTGRLIAGHGRLEALLALEAAGEEPPIGVSGTGTGWMLPVVHGWSSVDDTEAEALLVAVNRISPLGGWDNAMLTEMLSAIASTPLSLDGVGYTIEQLQDLQDQQQLPPLDLAELAERHGRVTNHEDMWPSIELKLPPDLRNRWLMFRRSLSADPEHVVFGVLLDKAGA